jgi:ribosomal protein S6
MPPRKRRLKLIVVVVTVAVDTLATRQLKTDTQRMIEIQRAHAEEIQRIENQRLAKKIERQHHHEETRYHFSFSSSFSPLSQHQISLSQTSHSQTSFFDRQLFVSHSSSNNRQSFGPSSNNRNDQLLSNDLRELQLREKNDDSFENSKLLIKVSLRVDNKVM